MKSHLFTKTRNHDNLNEKFGRISRDNIKTIRSKS